MMMNDLQKLQRADAEVHLEKIGLSRDERLDRRIAELLEEARQTSDADPRPKPFWPKAFRRAVWRWLKERGMLR